MTHAGRFTIAAAAEAYRAGRLDEAEAICGRLLRKKRQDTDALQLLGTIATRRGDHATARAHYERCVAIRPRVAHHHYLVGKIDALEGRLDDALERYDRALALEPGNALASSWKAAVLERLGDDAGAAAALGPFVSAGTETADMAEVQAKLDARAGRHAEAIARAERHLADPATPPHARIALLLVAARSHERTGDYDRAFEAYRGANEAIGGRFDPDAHAAFVDRLIAAYSPEALATLPRASARTGRAVIIAGMPRSGTTLVEQIIDAHPRAGGAGELPDLERRIRGLPAELGVEAEYPECLSAVTPAHVERWSAAYLDRLAELCPGASRVVNKSLENYKTLGFASLLCPDAYVIRCRRDPTDTCFSCWASHLLPGSHGYASSLEHLGVVYRAHDRLMEHWLGVLDLPVLEVRYERVVEDPESACRRIIDFCGLEWDDRCLDFHRTGRPVLTLSYDQVRRPVYRSSVGRWRHFERHLGALRVALSAGGGA